MHPELFHLPFFNFAVHSYGLMLVIGLLLAMELAKFFARRSGLNPDYFTTAGILALVSGLIGARLAYVIQFNEEFRDNGKSFWANFLSAINIPSGGLVYYGGFLLAFVTLVVYARWRKIPLMRGMDIVAPCVMVGLAFGRIGCFLNGCCWGQACELPAPIAVQFPYGSPAYIEGYRLGTIHPDPRLIVRDPVNRRESLMPRDEAIKAGLADVVAAERTQPVINTQIISTITAGLIAIATALFFTFGAAPGRGMALMLVMEGLTRTLIEGMRVEPTEVGTLTLSMVIGLSIATGGVVLWVAAGWLSGSDRSDTTATSDDVRAQGAIG